MQRLLLRVDGVDAADAGADDDASLVLVDVAQSAVRHGFVGCEQCELTDTVEAVRVRIVDIGDLEVLDFTTDAGPERCGIEGIDRGHPGAARGDAVPERLATDADRGDRAETGDDDSMPLHFLSSQVVL